ncbi:hypothetical protein Trydic_g3041 [Trypoxylus dichotomus]
MIANGIKILYTTAPHKFYWEDVDFSCRHSCSYFRNIVKGGFDNGYDLYIGKAYHICEWKKDLKEDYAFGRRTR